MDETKIACNASQGSYDGSSPCLLKELLTIVHMIVHDWDYHQVSFILNTLELVRNCAILNLNLKVRLFDLSSVDGVSAHSPGSCTHDSACYAETPCSAVSAITK